MSREERSAKLKSGRREMKKPLKRNKQGVEGRKEAVSASSEVVLVGFSILQLKIQSNMVFNTNH